MAEYKYTGDARLVRARIPVLESDLTKLDSRTLDIAIKNKIIKKNGKKGGSDQGRANS